MSAAATNRRGLYERRIQASTTEREKVHALVWWWMAEIRKLPADRRQAEINRVKQMTEDLNEGKAA